MKIEITKSECGYIIGTGDILYVHATVDGIPVMASAQRRDGINRENIIKGLKKEHKKELKKMKLSNMFHAGEIIEIE